MIKNIIMYVFWWIFILAYFLITADKNPLILIMFTLIATLVCFIARKYAKKSESYSENTSDKLSNDSDDKNKPVKKKKSVLYKFKSKEHIVKLVLGELLAISALLLFIDLFKIQCNIPFAVFVAFFINFLIWLEWGRKTSVYGIILFVFGFILIGFIRNSAIYTDGILLFINRISDTIGRYSGIVLKRFAVSTGSEAYYIYNSYIISLGAGFIGLISYFIVTHKQKFFLYVYSAIVSLSLIVFRIEVNWVYFVFYMISVMFVCWYHQKLHSDREFFKGLIGILAITCMALLISYPLNNLIRTHRSPFDAIVYNATYKKSGADSYGTGAIAGHKLVKKDAVALELTMSEPSAVYLKGYTGHKFNGNRWCVLDNESIYDSREHFYVLNKNGFIHYNQTGYLGNFSDDMIAKEISVKYVNAGDQCLFLPYGTKDFIYTELIDDKADLINKKSDINEYNLNFYPTIYLDYQDYSIDESNEAYVDYDFYENHYEAYVNNTYLHLSENDRNTIEKLVERNNAYLNVNRNDYETIGALVKAILKNELSYDETVEISFWDNDCLDTLFNDIKKGYDIHYATAATLMFRYFGVPSRYVEGYILTNEEANAANSGESLTITGKNAHAWTEIYVSDIGWMPIEVCDSYYNKMFEGKDELVISLTSNLSDSSGNRALISDKLTFVFVVFIGFLLLVLVFFAVVFIRRMIIIKNRRALTESDDYAEAVNAYCDYFCKILKFCKLLDESDDIKESFKTYRESLQEGEVQNFDKMINVFVSALGDKKIKKKDYIYVSESVQRYIEQITDEQSVITNMGLYLIVGV